MQPKPAHQPDPNWKPHNNIGVRIAQAVGINPRQVIAYKLSGAQLQQTFVELTFQLTRDQLDAIFNPTTAVQPSALLSLDEVRKIEHTNGQPT